MTGDVLSNLAANKVAACDSSSHTDRLRALKESMSGNGAAMDLRRCEQTGQVGTATRKFGLFLGRVLFAIALMITKEC